MAQVSKAKMVGKVWKFIWARFVKFVAKTEKERDVRVLIDGLLTPTETTMLAKRFVVGLLSLSVKFLFTYLYHLFGKT